MLDLAVLGHDPMFGGGGSAQTTAFLETARALGRTPELLYRPHPNLAGQPLTLDRVEAVRQLRAARELAPRCREARSLWVATTIATAGGAAPRTGRPYGCWIGTTLDDEWRGRRAGLTAAHRLAFGASLPALRQLERRVLRGAKRVYATSPGSREAITTAAGIDDVEILPIPVDIERFRPISDEAWRAQLQQPVLVFVGRAWDPRKNVALLLEALPLLRRTIPGARIRLVGEPPRCALPEGVDATGAVADVAPHLRDATLFVLPSHQEGFGIVAAEALAAGVPVLSTRSHGPEELVLRSGGGRLLETFSPHELAATAAELLRDPATLETMRRQGREYVEREHNPTTFRLLLERALDSIDND
ncbi:MAG TPA: glycosyltransferase family 4 protein [Gaiellaceae bacterium]